MRSKIPKTNTHLPKHNDFYLSLKLNPKRPDFSGVDKKAFMNHYKF